MTTLRAILALMLSACSLCACDRDFLSEEATEEVHNWGLPASTRPRDLSSCTVRSVVLTHDDVRVGMFVIKGSFVGEPGSSNGGQIALSDPSDPSVKVGDYSFFTQFFSTDPVRRYFPCVGTGAYTFGDAIEGTPRDQVTFTASCSNSPFFTITGGTGKYLGASGYVEFMIPVEAGFRHDIYLCKPKFWEK